MSQVGVRPLSQRFIGRDLPAKVLSLDGTTGAKRKRQALSDGRGKPLPPQSAVVVKCFFVKHEFDKRKAGEGQLRLGNKTALDLFYAPIPQTPNGCRAMVGELAYCIVGERSQLPRRYQGNPTTDIVAFTDVGGIKRGTKLSFVGIVEVAPDSTHDNSDYFGTLQTAGTCTAINTGPHTIPAMSLVCFDEEPYMVGGKPGVLEKGQPTDKFRPATVAFKHRDIYAFQKVAQLEVAAFMKTEAGITSIERGTASTQSAVKNLASTCMLQIPSTFPIERYIALVMFMEVMNLSIVTGTINNFDEMSKVVGSFYAIIIEPMKKERAKQLEAMGQSKGSAAPWFEHIDKPWNGPKGGDTSDSASSSTSASSSGKADKEAKPNTYVLDYMRELSDLRDIICAELHGWLRAHAIGMSMTSSESGAPLDLMLGFFF